MEPMKVIELQNAIVAEAASCIKSRWDAAFINVEIRGAKGNTTEDCLALLFRKGNGTWQRDSFDISMRCLDLFAALYEDSLATQPWSSCTLEFDSTGVYKFSFSYDQPLRLNGNFSSKAMFEDYTPDNK